MELLKSIVTDKCDSDCPFSVRRLRLEDQTSDILEPIGFGVVGHGRHRFE
jgi:hypothetical protein